MCGLVGVITDERTFGAQLRAKYMRQALIIDTLRGEDSTGMFLVPHTNPIGMTADWYKRVGDGYAFTESEGYLGRMTHPGDYAFMVGHNRAATQGVVNAQNAHPFEEGPITMVHNGTLRDDTTMPKSMAQLGVEVDSHAICHNLAVQPNTVEGVQAVVETLDGAFALIWHDARDNSLNIVRNGERPLHFVQERAAKTMYFASEAEMLALLVRRLKINAYDECHFPEAGLYMKFAKGNVLKPEVHPLELYKPVYTSQAWGGGWGGHGNGWYDKDGNPINDDKGNKAKPKRKPVGGNNTTVPKSRQNRTLLGGMLRPVPLSMQRYMESKGYSIEDRYEFLPVHVQKRDIGNINRSNCIYGYIGGRTKLVAQVVGMAWHPDTYAMDRSWTVRPIGISEGNDGKHMLIVRMEDTTWTDSKYICREEEKAVDELEFKGQGYYPLFGNAYVNGTRWLEETLCGCKVCGDKPPLDEAYDVDWVAEAEFICLSCQVALDADVKDVI